MKKMFSIGISGVRERCGCTHMSLVIANFLRSHGYKTAILELNASGAFEDIREACAQKLKLSKSFTYNDIDFYPFFNNKIIRTIKEKDYQFVISDYGFYGKCNKAQFCKCDIPIFLCGCRPWETKSLIPIFNEFDDESLKNYFFFFNFAENNEKVKQDIMEGMGNVSSNVFFPAYTEDPFMSADFPGAASIIGNFLAKEDTPVTAEKKGIFSFRAKKESIGSDDLEKIDPVELSTDQEITEPIQEEPFSDEDSNKESSQEVVESSDETNSDTANEPVYNKEIINSDNIPEENNVTPDQDMPAVLEPEITDNRKDDQNTNEDVRIQDDPEIKTSNAEIKRRRMIDLITGDESPIRKIGTAFSMNNFSRVKPVQVPEVPEPSAPILRNLAYTNVEMQSAIVTVKKSHKKIKNLSIENTDKEKIRQLSNLILQNMMCAVIRSGTLCKRETGQDGMAAITVNISGMDISCPEERINKILGQEKSIVSPYEDTYQDV